MFNCTFDLFVLKLIGWSILDTFKNNYKNTERFLFSVISYNALIYISLTYLILYLGLKIREHVHCSVRSSDLALLHFIGLGRSNVPQTRCSNFEYLYAWHFMLYCALNC